MKLMKQFKMKIFLGAVITLLSCQKSYAAVNIITWWGFLNEDIVAELENKCETTISYDEYYTSEEILKNLYKQNYSIAIFETGIYHVLAEKVANKGTSLQKIKQSYHPRVLQALSPNQPNHVAVFKNLPNNVGVFSVEVGGFLYHPEKISINPNDSIKDILKQAIGKKIAILDNPINSLRFISPPHKTPEEKEAIQKFRELFHGIEVIITNDLANALKDKNIVLIHTWQGVAYSQIKNNPKLKFTFHPQISYLGGDLIASLDKTPETACVAKTLAGKEMNSIITANEFMMSPYGAIELHKDQSNVFYSQINNDFFEHQINSLKYWYEIPKKEEYQEIINLWQRIKIANKN